MSEYTTVYLRYKNTPLLEYREHPSFEETRNLSKDEIMTAIHEVDEYNKNVRKSFGCELFHLSTTPSRQLDVLQWSIICLDQHYLLCCYDNTNAIHS